MVSVHVPPDIDTYCGTLPAVSTKPVFRLPIGGAQIESAVDITKGIPNSCSLIQGLMGDLQTGLAAIQPILTILDVIATMAQCVQLTGEVFSDPFKIGDLLACIPNLTAKLSQLLALVPIFPQGIAQVLTSVVDVLEFTATVLDCLVQQLTAVQQALQQAADDINAIEALPQGPQRDRLEELVNCGMVNAQETVGTAVSVLGPIARVICAIRGILLLAGPPGKELAGLLAFPDVSNPSGLDVASGAIATIRDVLTTAIEAVRSIGAPFGAPFPPPELVFRCPLDDDPSNFDTAEPEPPVQATITDVLDAASGVSLGSPPQFNQGTAAQEVLIIGTNFISTDESIPNWGTSPLEGSRVETDKQIRVTIPAGVKTNTGNYFLAVVNQPPGGEVAPFSGLSDPNSGESTVNQIVPSELFPVEVV